MNVDRATELRRLARVLHKDSGTLDYLDPLNGLELQQLRSRIQLRLLDEFGPMFEKLAGAGKIAPDKLSAFLCKRIFGPALTANMSYYTPVHKAVSMCGHFDEEFMAEVAREQVPERAVRQLEELPVDIMRPVTRKLLESGDFHVMGGFTDHLPEEKVRELMEEIEDPADHLRVSAFAQRKDRIARLTAGFDDDMLREFIVVAFSHPEFLREVSLVTAAMDPEDQVRAARITDGINPEYRKRARQLAEAEGLLDDLQAYFDA